MEEGGEGRYLYTMMQKKSVTQYDERKNSMALL
jgi:hypothetical protein